MESDHAKRTRVQRWWPFALLCVLSAGRWMALDLAPSMASTLPSLFVAASCAALGVAGWSHLRGHVERASARCLAECFCAGAMLLAGPFLALIARMRIFEVTSLTIALALAPVVVAVARPAFRQTEGAELAGRMWPGIAAVAGFLLILPEPSLAGWREDGVLALAPLLTGVGAAWLRTRGGGEAPKTVAALAGSATVFLGAALIQGAPWHGALAAGGLDALLLMLSVAALFRLGATRWSAQFVLVPLVVMVEGLAGMGFRPDTRSMVGLLLVALSSAFLLLPPRHEGMEELVPRG